MSHCISQYLDSKWQFRSLPICIPLSQPIIARGNDDAQVTKRRISLLATTYAPNSDSHKSAIPTGP